MTIPEISFWILLGIIVYAYGGYGILVMVLGRVIVFFKKEKCVTCHADEPSVTLLVPAFNEEACLERKIENSLNLDYPKDKLQVIVVTDGSHDRSAEIADGNPRIVHLHQAQRRGKMAALKRTMQYVNSEIVVFSDANAMLNREAIRELVSFFGDPAVGCVCGEKRIAAKRRDDLTGIGEGLYWRYESVIKKWEARLGSCVGAVGELFAVRTRLFPELPDDTLVDDFAVSLHIALKGYRIQYAPGAYAIETASLDIGEELKRKIRIAAGNLQFILRMPELLNPFGHGMLAFEYFSHKFLRSFVVPFCLVMLIPLNLFLSILGGGVYYWIFFLQMVFYLSAASGYFLKKRRFVAGLLYIPFYVVLMNIASLMGMFRYLSGRQSVLWEKAARNIAPELEEDQ